MRLAVTGAFGYSGRAIATRLLSAGHEVLTLTGSPGRANPFAGRVAVAPLRFADPEAMAADLRGCEVLVNTWWVRYPHDGRDHAWAVRCSVALFLAARLAGVRRIVHVSITNPDRASPLSYFSGKAAVEDALRASGLSFAILRPAVLFGGEDILINNIAWCLRHLPAFGVFGDGDYRLQPIHRDDFADLAVAQALGGGDAVVQAIGPETWTYLGLVTMLRDLLAARTPVIRVPPWLGLQAGWALSIATGDTVITAEEIAGLMQGRLHVEAPPAGTTSLRAWAGAAREALGRHYHHELRRRRDLGRDYASLDAVRTSPLR